jgi:nucleoside-diphosphate-sugar epimerase
VRIFVTGATGVVGRRLVPLLCRADHEVTAVGRSPLARKELSHHGAAAVAVDLFHSHAVKRAVAGHDAVINLATHIPHSGVQMFLPWS